MNNDARILFIIDQQGWAHEIKTDNLIRVLCDEFDCKKRLQNEVTAEEIDNADLIVIYYWRQFRALKHLKTALKRSRGKLLCGICSHHELRGKWRRKGLKNLKKHATTVFTNNKLLYDEFRPYFKQPVFYTPNGVDTDFFQPADREDSGEILRVGWAGSLDNQTREHRGVFNYIQPAVEAVEGVELILAAREDKLRDSQEMRQFYHSLDAYICASRDEGTPNPCLEAAACGIPLITTPVGNMPELVEDGVNGFFIGRDVQVIAERLNMLRDHPKLRKRMKSAIRESIEGWDWRFQAENYRGMFRSVLAGEVNLNL